VTDVNTASKERQPKKLSQNSKGQHNFLCLFKSNKSMLPVWITHYDLKNVNSQ